MTPTAPPPGGPVPPPSAVDPVAVGLGQALVDAIVAGDHNRLEALFAADLRFRALTPRTHREASTAAGAREIVQGWFDDTDQRELLASTVEMVGERLIVVYRIGLTKAGAPRVVEQHVAAAVDGGRLRDVALVCSGFEPLVWDADRAVGSVGADVSPGGVRGTAVPDAAGTETMALAPGARLDATGLSCATLTPTIRSAVLGIHPGAVLEIVTDDPEAEEGLRSWTRLTGHELVGAEAGPGSARRFHIRRSPRRAAPTEPQGAN